MLDYKECSLAEFEAAMQQKNADISTIKEELQRRGFVI